MLLPAFIDKLHEELSLGHTKEAMLLINNTTDTAPGQSVLEKCDAVCFMRGRIKFLKPENEEEVNPTQGQMFACYGPNNKKFKEIFGKIGVLR